MEIFVYVWVYIGIYGYEGVIYGWIWVYMGCIWFCLAINGNKRLKFVSMVMYALKIGRYGYAYVYMGIY